MSLNVFGCPRSSLATHKDIVKDKDFNEQSFRSCGIWTQASMINHSCTNTAHRAFIGDMMIIRATQDLKPGEEVTFWYEVPNGHERLKMQETLKNWGFECTCAICQDAKHTRPPVFAQRRGLWMQMKQVDQPLERHCSRMERLLTALNATYARPVDEVPRLLVFHPQLMLARMYRAQRRMEKVLENIGKALTSLGFVLAQDVSPSSDFRIVKWGLVFDHSVEAFVLARDAFAAYQALDSAKSADTYARTAFKVVVGEDASFATIYGE
jgi:hypothetical protein